MTLTEYELERQRRMEENRRRMEQLGLPQMAEGMAQAAAADAPPRKKREKRADAGPALEPSRRSSRNEGKERPVYVFDLERTGSGSRKPRDGPLVKDGEREEVYGVEHVLSLGSYKKEWEMFTDGYTTQGERIYDPDNGASCHQCRQKTLGLRTSCSRCSSGLGMLCGDCLFARYGENVQEVVEKKDWVCPCCRDLCNCSTHRKKKGWEATGALHRSVKSRGYLSVAHYLVLNKAGGLEAKRAALASGFCPEELEEKLQIEIKQLEEEAAAAPPPPAAEEQPEQDAAEQEQQQQKGSGKRRKSEAVGGSSGKAKSDAAAESKAKGKGKAAEAATGEGSKKKRKAKEQKKVGKEAAGSSGAAKEAAGKKKGAADGRQQKQQRKRKSQQAGAAGQQDASPPASSPTAAAAAGVLETSGASGSGAVAAGASPTGDVEVTAPAVAAAVAATAKAGGIVTKAPFSRKRAAGGLPGSGAALMEVVAAPARRRRSGSL